MVLHQTSRVHSNLGGKQLKMYTDEATQEVDLNVCSTAYQQCFSVYSVQWALSSCRLHIRKSAVGPECDLLCVRFIHADPDKSSNASY